jgi:hypothetical protein
MIIILHTQNVSKFVLPSRPYSLLTKLTHLSQTTFGFLKKLCVYVCVFVWVFVCVFVLVNKRQLIKFFLSIIKNIFKSITKFYVHLEKTVLLLFLISLKSGVLDVK